MQAKYKVPSQNIVYVDRAPQKNHERNRAVLIHSRHGKRFSVVHGGVGGGRHVTKYWTGYPDVSHRSHMGLRPPDVHARLRNFRTFGAIYADNFRK